MENRLPSKKSFVYLNLIKQFAINMRVHREESRFLPRAVWMLYVFPCGRTNLVHVPLSHSVDVTQALNVKPLLNAR